MSNSNEPPALYSRDALAFLEREYGLHLEWSTLNKMAHEGRGPAFHKDGRLRLYPRAELVKWAEERLGAPSPRACEHFVNREKRERAA